MTLVDQKKFYAHIGRALTAARQQRNMSVAQLSGKTGEHHKTIRGIEDGRPHSAHHVVWMTNVLGMDYNKLITQFTEGMNGKESSGATQGNGDGFRQYEQGGFKIQSKLDQFI